MSELFLPGYAAGNFRQIWRALTGVLPNLRFLCRFLYPGAAGLCFPSPYKTPQTGKMLQKFSLFSKNATAKTAKPVILLVLFPNIDNASKTMYTIHKKLRRRRASPTRCCVRLGARRPPSF